ncbi:YbaK/EbsC family protein [Streptomyces sp. NPDC001135]
MTTTATDTGQSGARPGFAEATRALGPDDVLARTRRFPETTRTAAGAAAAIGREAGRIRTSPVFAADGVPMPVLGGGASRVDGERVPEEPGAGEAGRARAGVVRATTGYAIGDVPPCGHRTRTRVLAGRSPLAHHGVRAAAGIPHAVFPAGPEALVAHAGAGLVDGREQTA